jgi:glycosyltransferase involved in cell wall biosynthesis
MRIGLIAPPWVQVPPPRYGGTEQVVDDLAREFVGLGHEVLLFTVAGSTCPVPQAWYFDGVAEPLGAGMAETAHVLAGYRALAEVDVIHDHTLLGPLIGGRLAGAPPVVTTVHGPFTPDARTLYLETARTASLVSISHAQRATAPEIPVTAVIHHGIDLTRYTFGAGKGDFLLFVGRMSPDKGLDRAIRVARRAGRRLVVVGKMHQDEEKAYFESVVRPLLGDDIEVMGELTAPERIELMRSAVALVNPICWPEPFGLVMAEALACGTPVIAYPNGAAPEIVDTGVTGWLCSDEDDMVRAVSEVAAIDRRACRAAAEQHFDRARMARDHVRLYERVVQTPQAGGATGRRERAGSDLVVVRP